jgi:hypothetical protein
MLADVGPHADEEHARDVCEDLQHMVPIDKIIAGAWK